MTIQMTQTEEMCITGRYGMEISHFLNIGNISSAMPLSLDSSLSHVKRQWKPSLMIRQTGIFSLILWRSTRETTEQTERL